MSVHHLDESIRRGTEALDQLVSPPGEPMPNARRFLADRFSHRARSLLVHQGGAFYAWNGACWPELDDAELRAMLYEFFEHCEFEAEGKQGPERKPFAPNRYKIADLVDALRAVAITPATATPAWLSGGDHPAHEYVACQNGLVHVPTRTLHEHTPQFFQHHSVPFDFDPEAPRPERWYQFLRELWGDDQESVDTLQELFGYLITADTRLQKMFLLVGPRRSGKGTIARVIKALIGAHNIAGPTLSSMGTDFGLAPLIGKPVAIISDARLRNDCSVITERLLSISGEDTLDVNRKYRPHWTGQLPSRIVILSNELPRFADSSGALASRFIVLTFQVSFYGREDHGLTDTLCSELAGIFNWALDGLERLRQRGRFQQPEASQEAIRELEDLGSPIGAFIRDRCLIGPEHSVLCDHLYLAWKSWCEEHGNQAGNTQTFGRSLRAAQPGIRIAQPRQPDGANPRRYVGIGLTRNNNDPKRVSTRVTDHDPDLTRDDTRFKSLYCGVPESRVPRDDAPGIADSLMQFGRYERLRERWSKTYSDDELRAVAAAATEDDMPDLLNHPRAMLGMVRSAADCARPRTHDDALEEGLKRHLGVGITQIKATPSKRGES